jgi:hypothetical protein
LDEEHSLASGFFLVTLFLAAEEKVTGLKGFESKTGKDASKRQRMFFIFHLINISGSCKYNLKSKTFAVIKNT